MKARYKMLIIAVLAALPGILTAAGVSDDIAKGVAALSTIVAGFLAPPARRMSDGDLSDLK